MRIDIDLTMVRRQEGYKIIEDAVKKGATIEDLEDLKQNLLVQKNGYNSRQRQMWASGRGFDGREMRNRFADMDDAKALADNCDKIIAKMRANLPPRKPEIILAEVDLTEGLRETIQKYIDSIQNDVRSRKKGEKELKQLITDLKSQKGTLVQGKVSSYHDRLTFADKIVEFCQIQLAIVSDPLAGFGGGVAAGGAPRGRR